MCMLPAPARCRCRNTCRAVGRRGGVLRCYVVAREPYALSRPSWHVAAAQPQVRPARTHHSWMVLSAGDGNCWYRETVHCTQFTAVVLVRGVKMYETKRTRASREHVAMLMLACSLAYSPCVYVLTSRTPSQFAYVTHPHAQAPIPRCGKTGSSRPSRSRPVRGGCRDGASSVAGDPKYARLGPGPRMRKRPSRRPNTQPEELAEQPARSCSSPVPRALAASPIGRTAWRPRRARAAVAAPRQACP